MESPNPVVHYEIMCGPDQDVAAHRKFYADTFGWKYDIVPEMDYAMVNVAPGTGIGGSVGMSPAGPQALIYIAVDDPVAYLAKAVANGAEKVMDVETVPGMVTFAMFRDPAGNLVGIVANEPPPAP
ncbi:MAG: VOC family protein [Dehalococcoidia bacterium]|nr:VOC family protein [Dehalococcoidia bacterium]